MFLLVFVLYPNPFNDLFLVSPRVIPESECKGTHFFRICKNWGKLFSNFFGRRSATGWNTAECRRKKMKGGSRRRKGLHIIYNTKPKEDMREKEKNRHLKRLSPQIQADDRTNIQNTAVQDLRFKPHLETKLPAEKFIARLKTYISSPEMQIFLQEAFSRMPNLKKQRRRIGLLQSANQMQAV